MSSDWGAVAAAQKGCLKSKFCKAGACFLLLEALSTFWGENPWGTPPLPTLPVPPPKQKGTNLLLYKFCVNLLTHQDLKLNCCRVMGQKLRYGRPCTRPTRHRQLACTAWHCFLSLEFHWLPHGSTILDVWSELLLHWLDLPRDLHLSAWASDFWTCPQDPLFTQLTQKGCQSTGLELRIPKIYF